MRASSSTPPKPGRPVAEDAMYVGYYVERGLLADDDPNRVMDKKWHWHGFYKCLSNPSLRHQLNRLMLDLPAVRRTIWISCSRHQDSSGTVHPEFTDQIRYAGEQDLDAARAKIDQIPFSQWINVMVGNCFDVAECLSRQADLVAEFRNPIVRGNEIRLLVEKALP
jgi:hypothetical protein